MQEAFNQKRFCDNAFARIGRPISFIVDPRAFGTVSQQQKIPPTIVHNYTPDGASGLRMLLEIYQVVVFQIIFYKSARVHMSNELMVITPEDIATEKD